jgi:TRAP-type C4-dicarboxylate transport system permease small subunit
MKKPKNISVEIDFDAMAEEDEIHFKNFHISWAGILLVLGFAFLYLIVFLQFFTRYVLNDSIAWTEEAARYLLILVTFAGAARCQIQGTHITLEFMDRFYGRFGNHVKRFASAVTLVLFVILAFTAWEMIQKTSFQQMVSLPFPKYYLHLGVLALLALNIFVVVRQLVFSFTQPQLN